MQQDSFDFLKKLVDTPGPSGYEQPVQRVFRDRVSAYSSDIRTDVMGNVFATVNPSGSPRIMPGPQSLAEEGRRMAGSTGQRLPTGYATW